MQLLKRLLCRERSKLSIPLSHTLHVSFFLQSILNLVHIIWFWFNVLFTLWKWHLNELIISLFHRKTINITVYSAQPHKQITEHKHKREICINQKIGYVKNRLKLFIRLQKWCPWTILQQYENYESTKQQYNQKIKEL